MTSLADHQSSRFVKLLYIGDSGTGKTGSLASLASDYQLRILDLDNGLDALRNYTPADLHKQIDFITVRDTYRATPLGPVIRGTPKAFIDSLKLLEKWSDGSDPSEWGDKTVFVLDSGSSFGRAGYEWAKGMNPSAKDPRQWYFGAQQAFENTIALLTGEAFHANVIVISHINWREMQDGMTKGHANAIGSALGPVIARYFNTLILAKSTVQGQKVTRTIKTVPTATIDLKVPRPSVSPTLPLASGLSTIFSQLKEPA